MSLSSLGVQSQKNCFKINSECHCGKKCYCVKNNSQFNFTLIQLHIKSSAQSIPLNCTKCRLSKGIVHSMKSFRLLVDPRGTRKATLFCRSATRTFLPILLSCHLSKCGDVTEAELIMTRAGIRGMSATQNTRITICPRHRHSLGRFWRAPKTRQHPGPAYWEGYSFDGKTRHKLPNGRGNMYSFWQNYYCCRIA